MMQAKSPARDRQDAGGPSKIRADSRASKLGGGGSDNETRTDPQHR